MGYFSSTAAFVVVDIFVVSQLTDELILEVLGQRRDELGSHSKKEKMLEGRYLYII